MIDRTRIIDKIKKCLALSKSANEHEAAAALRQAQKLMDAHELGEDEILISEVQTSCAKSGARRRPVAWENELAWTVSEAFGCKLIFLSQRYASGSWEFVGCGIASELARYAFEVLYRQLKRSRREFIQIRLSRCSTPTKRRRADAFCKGWVTAIRSKVHALKSDETHQRAVAAYMENQSLSELQTTDRQKYGKFTHKEIADWHAGHQDGHDAELHRGVRGSETEVAFLTLDTES